MAINIENKVEALFVPDANGEIRLGNFTLYGDQTVGAGQDNYVLTYDDALGQISLEASGGGVWTDNGSGNIEYSNADSLVEITDGTANTLGTASLRAGGNLLVGINNTFGGATTTISKLAVIGDNNTVGAGSGSSIGNGLVIGATNTIPQLINGSIFGSNNSITGGTGSLVFMMGNSHTTDSTITTLIGENNETNAANTMAIGENVIANVASTYVFGKNVDTSNAAFIAGTYMGHGNASNSFPLMGIGLPATQTSKNRGNMGIGVAAASNLCAFANNTGDGILYIGNYANQAIEPTANATDSVGIWAKDRAAGSAGLKIKEESGTHHFLGDFSAIGGDETDANANKTLTVKGTGTGSGTSSLLCEDSAGASNLEVKDNGVVNMANLPTSSTGLSAGDLWNNSGVINIV